MTLILRGTSSILCSAWQSCMMWLLQEHKKKIRLKSVSADLLGKERQGKKGKMEQKRRKIEKVKVEKWKWFEEKLPKWGEDHLFFVVCLFLFLFLFCLFVCFLLFTFQNHWNLFWVYQNGTFLPGKSISRGNKIRKNDFAPSVKYSSYAPAWSWTIMYNFTHCMIFWYFWFDRMKEQWQEKVIAVLNVYQYKVSLWLECVSVITRDWLLKFAEERQIVLLEFLRKSDLPQLNCAGSEHNF